MKNGHGRVCPKMENSDLGFENLIFLLSSCFKNILNKTDPLMWIPEFPVFYITIL
jgi:hypothetical protein